MSFLLGIDKGTSVIKAVVFDVGGVPRGLSHRRVQVLQPQPGWHEEDPRATWALCVEVIREAIAEAGIRGDEISGIGIAGHMGGAWLIGKDGLPVRNAICWPDSRAQSRQVAMEKAGVLEEVFDISGNGLMPGITAMALGWLVAHEPSILNLTQSVVCAKDYLRYCLTDVIATDASDVSYVPGDIDGRKHSARVMELCGADAWMGKLPKILPSGAIAGRITAKAAQQTGLSEGKPVITGLGDACANAVGIGAIEPGSALTVLGSSCLNSQVLDGPERRPAGLGFLFAMPFDRYLRILPNTSGTIAFDWFLDRFGAPTTTAGHTDFAVLEATAAAIPRGAGGVIFIPYVNGSGVLAPFFDTLARGSFFGVGSHTSHAHLLRAVYEALCYATRDCFEAMNTRPRSLVLTGGGAKSTFWAQLFADICGTPIEISSAEESGALGVALLAGVASGVWPDLEAAVIATSRVAARFEPNPAAAAEYDGWFELYQRTRDVYRRHSADRTALLAEKEMAA
jgi:sugar (pentulose or hexulose) kinase